MSASTGSRKGTKNIPKFLRELGVDSWTNLPNSTLDHLMTGRYPEILRVMACVVRHSFGYQSQQCIQFKRIKGKLVAVPLLQADIAEKLELCKQNVHRATAELEEDGLIDFDGRRILLNAYPKPRRNAPTKPPKPQPGDWIPDEEVRSQYLQRVTAIKAECDEAVKVIRSDYFRKLKVIESDYKKVIGSDYPIKGRKESSKESKSVSPLPPPAKAGDEPDRPTKKQASKKGNPEPQPIPEWKVPIEQLFDDEITSNGLLKQIEKELDRSDRLGFIPWLTKEKTKRERNGYKVEIGLTPILARKYAKECRSAAARNFNPPIPPPVTLTPEQQLAQDTADQPQAAEILNDPESPAPLKLWAADVYRRLNLEPPTQGKEK